jgi:stage III sporulation protein AF
VLFSGGGELKAYLLRLTAAAILAAVLRRLAPDGGAGRGTRLGAGLLVLLTALGPLGQLDLLTASQALYTWGSADLLTAETLDQEKNQLLSALISQSAETYILDKAQELGLEVTVQVETQIQDGVPVPWRVTVRGDKGDLGDWITQKLGIPQERQEWLDM